MDIDGALIQQATASRPDYAAITQQTQKALATLYATDSLRNYVIEFSPQEDEKKRLDRAKKTLAHYQNHVARIGNQYVEGVFAKPVERTSNNEGVQQYLQKRYADWFRSEVARASLVLDELYVLVERMEVIDGGDKKSLTRADQRLSGRFPRSSVIYPQHVCNFSQDDDGFLQWVSIKESIKRDGKDKEAYRIYTDTQMAVVAVSEGKAFYVKAPQDHGFFYQRRPACPVVRMVWEENYAHEVSDDGGFGHAMMTDTVRLTIGQLQLLAMLIENGYAVLCPFLVAGPQTAGDIGKNGVGANRVIIEGRSDGPEGKNPEANQTRFLTKDSLDFDTLIDLVFEKYPAMIQTAARLRDRQTTAGTSGLSKLLDSAPEIAVLSEVAQHFQRYDERIASLIAYAYDPGATVEIVYPELEEIEDTSTGGVSTAAQEGADMVTVRDIQGSGQEVESLSHNGVRE